MFEHTNDKDWQTSRIANWENEDTAQIESDFTKTQFKALKEYYLNGDILDLIAKFKNKKQILLLGEIMRFGPFTQRCEFDNNVEAYCAEYAVEKLEQNIPFYDSERLIEGLCRHLIDINFELHYPMIGETFYSSIVEELYGDRFEPVISYPTEFAVIGKVDIPVNPDYMFHRFSSHYRSYLTKKACHQSHVVYKGRLPYYLSLFNRLTTTPFSLAKLNNDDFENYTMSAKPSSIQSIFRALAANLYGYKHEYDKELPRVFGLNDEKFRDELRHEIESLKLGVEYEKLVDMVHRHKGKVLYVSE